MFEVAALRVVSRFPPLALTMARCFLVLLACIAATGDGPTPGPVTVCGAQWCYVVPSYAAPLAFSYNALRLGVNAYETFEEAVTTVTKSTTVMLVNVSTTLGAIYWVLTHKPNFQDRSRFSTSSIAPSASRLGPLRPHIFTPLLA